MSQSKTVTINGMQYDAHSGLPVGRAPKPATHKPHNKTGEVHAQVPRQPHNAAGIHTKTQRSQTLNRAFVKHPKKSAATHAVPKTRMSMDGVATHRRSPHITKFATDPQAVAQKKHVVNDIGPVAHPIVAKVTASHPKAQSVKHQPRPAQEIKEKAISKALANAKPTSTKQHTQPSSRGRTLNIAASSLAILLMAGYFTYINMPSLSVRVAAAQAGIDASYPQYRPTGYRLNGPVAYRDGQVTMEFAANAGPQEFALNQTKSSWDSSALLANYVSPQSEGNYATYSDAGLTIYTYGTNAAWINGGILYTVQGSATLSNDQVRNIATSM